jgi:hypothetical protein
VSYQIIFDASHSASQFGLFVPFIVLFSLLAVIGWALRDSEEPKYPDKWIGFLVIGFLGLCAGFAFIGATWFEYRGATQALATHSYRVAEGVVKDFVPMPPGGHSTESFTLGGVSFHYGGGWGSIFFDSDLNKGYLHDGVQARIAYDDAGNILRVEVK